MPAVTIRRAEQADSNVLADIAYRAWESSILPLLDEVPGMRRAEAGRLAHAVEETWRRIIVAQIGGRAVGWCSRAARRPYIPYLFVSPELQGRGVGSALLRRMESLMELGGDGRVMLETPADNVRAVRFYQKQGYAIRPTPTSGPGAHQPFNSVRLEKRLAPFIGMITDLDEGY